MKASSLIIILTLLVTAQVFSQKKQCLEIESLTSNSEGRELARKQYKYDDNANLVYKSSRVDFGGNPPLNEEFFTYNNKNNLIKHETFFNNKKTYNEEYNYDELGNLIAQTNITGNKLSTQSTVSGDVTTINTLDDNGNIWNIIKVVKTPEREVKTTMNPKGEIINEETIVFNEAGLKTEYSQNDVRAKIVMRMTYAYNNLGKIISMEQYYNDDKVISSDYNYKDGLLISQITKNRKGLEDSRIEYTYNGILEIERRIFSRGELDTVKEKRYDENSNLIEEITSNAKGQLITKTFYKYECR